MVMDIAAAMDRELIFGKRQFFEQLFEQLFDHYFGKETIIRTTLQPISEYYCLRMERVLRILTRLGKGWVDWEIQELESLKV